MVSLQRRMQQNRGRNGPEQRFYSHTWQYLASTSRQQVKLEDWMISPFDVDVGKERGPVGCAGRVCEGTWNRTEVAIKIMRNESGVSANVEMLRQEIDTWMSLRHPNILQFLGANTLDDEPFIFPSLHLNLHARDTCHGDLKGINILVEHSGRALLCDFGLTITKADFTSRTEATTNSVVSGSRNWMAPELLAGGKRRPPTDIYSFGMMLYELYTDEIPLMTLQWVLQYGDFFLLVHKNDVRPEKPDNCPRLTDGVWNLAERSWMKNAKARPTARRQIHDNIKILLMTVPVPPPSNTLAYVDDRSMTIRRAAAPPVKAQQPRLPSPPLPMRWPVDRRHEPFGAPESRSPSPSPSFGRNPFDELPFQPSNPPSPTSFDLGNPFKGLVEGKHESFAPLAFRPSSPSPSVGSNIFYELPFQPSTPPSRMSVDLGNPIEVEQPGMPSLPLLMSEPFDALASRSSPSPSPSDGSNSFDALPFRPPTPASPTSFDQRGNAAVPAQPVPPPALTLADLKQFDPEAEFLRSLACMESRLRNQPPRALVPSQQTMFKQLPLLLVSFALLVLNTAASPAGAEPSCVTCPVFFQDECVALCGAGAPCETIPRTCDVCEQFICL
ncbi:kinase-like domain-containing protein [Roridomyces roridus]|uniref:Kinase-like domain-containing protein n=1 Tax=Roridomyces roridus TaxID=1738132 RepID=A0AAD7C2M0_9AGAR|nr:kinase-like domain-containing protein [Roridomyces roridus]